MKCRRKFTPNEIVDRAARAAAIVFDRPEEETAHAAQEAFDEEGATEPLGLLFKLCGKLPDAPRLSVVRDVPTDPIDAVTQALELAAAEARTIWDLGDGAPDDVRGLLALSLAGRLAAIRSFVAEGQLDRSPTVPTAEVRAALEEQARSDVKVALGSDEFKPPPDPGEWFQSWLDSECEHVLGTLSEEAARKIYEAEFHEALAKEWPLPKDGNGADLAEGSAES